VDKEILLTKDQKTINQLESQLTELENKQIDLNTAIKKLENKKNRFYNIFKHTTASLWEEDFSDAYKILKKLPCKSSQEYSKYLDERPKLLKELISKIKIIDVNEATLNLLGVKNKKQLILSLDKLFIKDSFSVLRDQFVTLAMGKYHYECETIGQKLNGEEFQVLVTVFFPDKTGKSALVSMMDISSRVKKDKLQNKLLKEIEEKKKIASILMNITFSMSSKNKRKDILDSVLEQIENVIPYSSANLMLIIDNKLKVLRQRGYDKFGAENFMNNFGDHYTSKGTIKTFMEVSRTQLIEDSENYPGWEDFPQTSYIKSTISIPIEWMGNTIGLINIDSTDKFAFTWEDASKLKVICSAAAISIQRSRLFEQKRSEIKKRKENEKILNNSLNEKELLLQEIHHRVKNNLTIIIALINMQNLNTGNLSNNKLFEELSQRVYSIALVHERMYENNDLASIDLYNYVQDLFNSIRSVMVYRSDIEFNINIKKNVYFNLDKLVPLGLILNELLTNSLKYAFSEIGGSISITLEKNKDNFLLNFKDTGIGYPIAVLEGKETHLGLILVNALVEQISGTVDFSSKNGAQTLIEFSGLENSDD